METIIITALCLLCALLIILLLRKRSSRGDSLQMGKNLEQLDRLVRQVDEISTVFHSPRLRGGLGEMLMEDLIRNRLPRGSYEFQYNFSGGQRADAVIRMGSYKVAVDAKFPLEQLKNLWDSDPDQPLPRNIRKIFLSHGQSIAEKYIHPREGTMPFALMYIPSENIYYRVFVASSASVLEELLALGVLPVGPSSFFTYLQTAAYGFKGFSFSSRSQEIMHLITQLRKDFETFQRQQQIAGSHLKNLQKAWDEGNSKLESLNRTVQSLDS